MPRQFIDNFEVTLTAAITGTGDVSIVLPAGTGAQLAGLTLSPTDVLALTITNGTTVEIVHATARSTDTLTVVRAREGTTAATFPIGSVLGCYPTAAGMRELQITAKRGTVAIPANTDSQHEFTITDADATTLRDVDIRLRPTEELDLDELDDYTLTAAILVDGTITVVISSVGYLAGTFAYTYTLTRP